MAALEKTSQLNNLKETNVIMRLTFKMSSSTEIWPRNINNHADKIQNLKV